MIVLEEKRMQAEAVKIEQYINNPNARAYHVRQELTEKAMFSVDRGDSSDYNGNPVAGITELLLAIRGVTSITLRPYQATVTKAVAFDWDEIEPRVLECLAIFKEKE